MMWKPSTISNQPPWAHSRPWPPNPLNFILFELDNSTSAMTRPPAIGWFMCRDGAISVLAPCEGHIEPSGKWGCVVDVTDSVPFPAGVLHLTVARLMSFGTWKE
ncbi:hypothetical protein CPSG_07189 [Coccidioides posadasii str. Silveira]|uniref:Uncharacterized protein n=1 Tax=Coccidioides posadasii (strain RMSCC 757 / Silveira) TaxID=443226 RepID=E9DBI7_COCPS|nr:hypothetical protein CPSG_07189 [Coccidioides posadasii str. Silveira]